MTILEVVQTIKAKHRGEFMGKKISEETTRDKILYGDANKECTGIVTTCYASANVIKEAAKRGANLIVCHESLFWNHGDHTDWLSNNKVFQAKKKLLDETGIVVWRNHDYIHSGVDIDGKWCDGIFYGLMKQLDWEKYLDDDTSSPHIFQLPPVKVRDLAEELMEKMHLNGIKTLGNPDATVSRLMIPFHIIGDADNSVTKEIDEKDIDVLLALEITDFTVGIFMRDAAELGFDRAVLAAGHFNVEEPGMEWFATYLPNMIGNDIPCSFVQSGDSYTLLNKRVG